MSEYRAASGVEVIVTNPHPFQTATKQALNQELVEDLMAIIYSFSGKLYGRRSARFRKLRRCVQEVLRANVEEPGSISKTVS